MFKLSKKKGFTLIEVLSSITLFAVLFMIILSMQLSVSRLERYNKQLTNYSVFMEELKNVMMYNSTYNEIMKLNLEHRYYISKENIDFEKVREKGFTKLFVETKPLEEPYLALNVEEGKVLKINLKLYTRFINNTKIMECEFYKGKYKK